MEDVTIGDFDGDDLADLAWAEWGALSVTYGCDHWSVITTLLQPGASAVAAVDIDGDGYDDLVSDKFAFRGGPTGVAFVDSWSAEEHSTTSGFSSFYPIRALGDINGDGFGDFGSGRWWWMGSVAGPQPQADFPGATFSWAAPAGDVNGDGYDDVYFVRDPLNPGYDPGRLEFWPGGGKGLSGPVWSWTAFYTVRWPITADVDGDGALEVMFMDADEEHSIVPATAVVLGGIEGSSPSFVADGMRNEPEDYISPILVPLGDVDGLPGEEVAFGHLGRVAAVGVDGPAVVPTGEEWSRYDVTTTPYSTENDLWLLDLASGDLDGDGDLDLFAAVLVEDGMVVVAWLVDDPATTPPNTTPPSSTPTPPSATTPSTTATATATTSRPAGEVPTDEGCGCVEVGGRGMGWLVVGGVAALRRRRALSGR